MNQAGLARQIAQTQFARRTGRVTKIAPGRLEASGPLSAVGDLCEVEVAHANAPILAEVAAVGEDRIVLIPLLPNSRIEPGAKVVARGAHGQAPAGDAFAGRAVDALGQPIDGGRPILFEAFAPLDGAPPAPLDRSDARTILETGVRALDGLLPIGRGQRIGVFAASGVGKTTLIKQLAAQIACDHCIVCLVGERGREVEMMWRTLASHGERGRYTFVAATSDTSAALRERAVRQALALAEHWRGKGEHVLLLLDSVTRYAMALREIGLAAGAPPTLRAYTPNVFAALPRLVERCGAVKSGGSITAILTILSETDDVDDPIVEVMKAVLDGHIVLSRRLAEQSRFPAIDITRSVSRQSEALTAPEHGRAARRLVGLVSAYEDARIMIDSGVYKGGANPRVDEAIVLREATDAFLRQRPDEHTHLSDTIKRLLALAGRDA